ncbi:uncharacterized protein [Apostichopus japonicus]|uniref:uncharacterized protein n=1 Tax=Stichopus japonicus TaxID=307972 RepID=UPI003AB1ACA7
MSIHFLMGNQEFNETGENSKKGTKKRFLHDAELDETSHTTEEPSSESGRFEDLDTPGVSPVAHITSRHQETLTPRRISNRPTPVKNEDLYDLLSRLLQVGEENRRLNIENKHDIDRLKLEILQAAPSEAEEVVECFNKKLSTVLELNQFEQKLKDQPFRQKVTSYLTTYSGADPGKMVLAMMMAVTENSLAEQYSYAGKSKNGVAKLPFKGLYLNKCIYYAVKRRFQSTPDLRVLVKNGVESWLRSSPMRSKREQQQHNSTLESDSDAY